MLKTERLIIKALESEDQETMVELLTDEIIKETYMIPDFKSREEVTKLFARMKELSLCTTRYVRGIYLCNTLIGIINDVGIEEGKIEVGYALNPQYHNQGYGTEMLKAVIAELFEKGYEEVLAGAFEDNIASRRIMEKAGMTLIDLREEIEYRGKVHQCVYYSIKNK